MGGQSDLEALYRLSTEHRALLAASAEAGCFNCRRTFAPAEIREWVDADPAGVAQTALCPRCGVDAVVPAAGIELTPDLLAAMRRRYL